MKFYYVLIVKEVYLCHRINHKKMKMKKNLRNILVLAMGLMTTVSFAQDWNVDSRTRIDMSAANAQGDDYMSTDQRATLGATWGGSDWGIHISSDVNYTFRTDGNNSQNASMRIYEAYASTDLMGYASVTAGRQALDYGSGAIMSSNQWGANRTTWDGFKFGANLDFADISFGLGRKSLSAYDGVTAVTGVMGVTAAAATDSTAAVVGVDAVTAVEAVDAGTTNMWLNVSKADADWSANLLYMSTSEGAGDAKTAMGLDLTYAMMGGDLNLSGSYNTSSGYEMKDDKSVDGDMMSFSAAYNVNESMTATGNITKYGENGFNVESANMQSRNMSGNLGYLNADDQDINVGIAYNMGDFDFGATMHKITNGAKLAPDAVAVKRDVNEISLGYTMSENANLSLSYASDKDGSADAETYMYITLNIRP